MSVLYPNKTATARLLASEGAGTTRGWLRTPQPTKASFTLELCRVESGVGHLPVVGFMRQPAPGPACLWGELPFFLTKLLQGHEDTGRFRPSGAYLPVWDILCHNGIRLHPSPISRQRDEDPSIKLPRVT